MPSGSSADTGGNDQSGSVRGSSGNAYRRDELVAKTHVWPAP